MGAPDRHRSIRWGCRARASVAFGFLRGRLLAGTPLLCRFHTARCEDYFHGFSIRMDHNRSGLNWDYDAGEKRHTLNVDGVQCTVWPFGANKWAGMVTRGDWSAASYGFTSADKAKTSCEGDLAQHGSDLLITAFR